ncbi:MAG: Type I restriction enzyme EcoR124II R protein [Candidatus Heimdallarchaeota archaeon LC_2]|nr:MAG: Type I restriction enzyme EcoR124II R protein [Candidatus Heimdallarchaeota archaeon LC_2]
MPDEVYMATELKWSDSYFLPFNKGTGMGAGNPNNPDGYKTDYLWKEVLQRDSLLEILGKFIHLFEEKVEVDGKKKTNRILIFPRYHQLNAVRKLTQDVHQRGAGGEYLIQHSAGSGKSNSISWLTHQLSNLHDTSDKLIFDSVIVVTDRKVLDNQIQKIIYSFDHVPGMVEHIDNRKGSKSTQLEDALYKGVKIIITTIQTFPRVLELIHESESLKQLNRKYAVVVDEAHSSQSGRSSDKMKYVLNYSNLDEAIEKEDEEDEELSDSTEHMLKFMKGRKKSENMSFFAFTATPKRQTLEKFGLKDKAGKYHPFHLYSMKQAIEEGFILDVLKNYTTYEVFLKIQKQIIEDPEYEKRKASRAISRFLILHPHGLEQKTEIMIEHFREVTHKKIGGKAKAMLVTSSRLHALRYKIVFDKYIKDNAYKDIKTLIAFSGTLTDTESATPDKEYTEASINKFKDSELPKKFASDEFCILIVANKYQTGFDQPLLHTMYVDKKLRGVQAVQTLSRLNRRHKLKDDTFVLDFINSTDSIKKAFEPFYEKTFLEGATDPNILFSLKTKLNGFLIYTQSEVDEFADVFYTPPEKQKPSDQATLNAILDPVVGRYEAKDEDDQDEFKILMRRYIQFYGYLSQIVPFDSIDLEKLSVFGRFLLKKLPSGETFVIPELEGEVALSHFRIDKTHEGEIGLDSTGEGFSQITTTTIAITREEEMIKLSELIEEINDILGTEFTEADGLFLKQLEVDILSSERIKQSAKVNSRENFVLGLEDDLSDLLVERMDENNTLINTIMQNEKIQKLLVEHISNSVYSKLKDDIDDGLSEIKETQDQILTKMAGIQTSLVNIQNEVKTDLLEALKVENQTKIEELTVQIIEKVSGDLEKLDTSEVDNDSIERNLSDYVVEHNWTKISEKSREELVLSQSLIDREIDVSVAIMVMCRAIEREVGIHIYNPLKSSIEGRVFPEFPEDLRTEKNYHQTAYSTLWKFVYQNKPLTLGMYTNVLSSLSSFVSKNKLQYFQLYKAFYDSLFDTFEELDIVEQAIRATKRFSEKMLIDSQLSVIDLRNFVAHPRNKKEKLVLDNSHFEELKEILLGKNGLLIKLL